jgi:putative ABC transport system permease protein
MILTRVSAWLHKRLLRLYPAEFREEFGTEMEQDFRDRMAHRKRKSLARVWTATLLDWLLSMPREQLDVTRRDLRASLRALARSPLFTLVAALSLAAGIAGTSVVFTIANSLLIQTPLKDPSRFVGVLRGDGSSEPSSWPDYADYRDRNRSFSEFAAWNIMPVFLGRGRQSQSVMAETVTDNYFDLIQVRPFMGRVFTPGECPSTCAQEVILSHRFWQHAYNGDPGIIGRQVPLSGVPATVIGIGPDGFDGTLAPVMTDIWIHVENRRLTDPGLFSDRNARWLAIAGRLKNGVSEAQAIADLNGIDRQLQRENRYAGNQDRRLWASVTRGIGIPILRRRVEAIVGLLGAVALLMLLISCANVANMVLARATARQQETAMRRALGAGSYRLIRLSLTESLVVAILGGAAGGLLSFWVSGLVPSLQPPANDLYTYRIAIHQDFRVWGFTFAVSLFCGLLFGILPALQAARADCLPAIRNQDPQGRPRWFARKTLVSCQVAFSVVLLVVAGLFYRSFASQQEIAPGFSVSDSLIVPLNLNLVSYAGDQAKGRRFFDAVKERVRALPGVESASLTSCVPLNRLVPQVEVRREGGTTMRAALDLIDPGYLAAMKVRLVGGRNFRDNDRDGSQPVALADERLVRHLWPGGPLEALGRTLRIGDEKNPVQIVGIVSSDFRSSLTDAPRPMLFLPVAQRYSSMLYLLVRTAPAPEELMEPVRRAVESVDDTVSLRRVRTLRGQVSDVLWPIRTGARTMAAACALAVLLAVLGLYGVIAYSMARRQREMGIRVALGARTSDVLRLVLRQGLTMTLWGVVIGVPLGAAANFALARTLYGLRPADPVVWSAGIAAWVLIACLASIPPAWRAVRNALAAIREPG